MMTAATLTGTRNNILSAIAPPRISAKEVETDAIMAVVSTGRETQRGVYLLAASDRQSPVAMPR